MHVNRYALNYVIILKAWLARLKIFSSFRLNDVLIVEEENHLVEMLFSIF